MVTSARDSGRTAGDSRIREQRSRGNAVSRESLLDAARSVFETCGYTSARVSDIVALAGLSHGSFYSYFGNKEDVFRAVADQVVRQIGSASASAYRGPDPRRRIASANRNYLEAFKANARMMAVVEEVATINEEFATFRRSLWRGTVERVERSMRRDQQIGLIDPGLNVAVTANALVGMLERFAFTWFILGEEFETDQTIDILTGIWLRGGGYRIDDTGEVVPWR